MRTTSRAARNASVAALSARVGSATATTRARQLFASAERRVEADNQRLFAEYFAGHPFIHVPAVLPAYSTRRVLTGELAAGATFREVLGWSQEERNLIGETLFRFVFGSLYRLHAGDSRREAAWRGVTGVRGRR